MSEDFNTTVKSVDNYYERKIVRVDINFGTVEFSKKFEQSEGSVYVSVGKEDSPWEYTDAALTTEAATELRDGLTKIIDALTHVPTLGEELDKLEAGTVITFPEWGYWNQLEKRANGSWFMKDRTNGASNTTKRESGYGNVIATVRDTPVEGRARFEVLGKIFGREVTTVEYDFEPAELAR